jgi:2-C-methyl-D-erythritol 4-phosphate cytidylyltransferase/2-C-methyl-D-erythritol 2,4-cyclodiphosphate synthase
MARVGLGYDSHRFIAGRPLVLGGVRIAHPMGLAGHSDADAALHAVTDAILGALGEGDIGQHFPDTDPQWADAESAVFVRHALALARDRGYVVANCDVTIVAESPALGPYKRQMQERTARLLEVAADAVAVKAKTNEGMGFTGQAEGVAALAIVLLAEA